MWKFRATGRGRHYTPWRGLVESVQSIAYAFDWPAGVSGLFPVVTRVRRVDHRLSLRAAGRPPLRIAFASDLHIGPLTPRRLLDNAFRLLADARPDVLALGGDYVSHEATPKKLDLLEQLVASVPASVKVAVLGNHDLWTHDHLIEAALVRAGARVLSNASFTLPPPHDDVALIGLDDAWTGQADATRAFAGVTASVRVVLSHPPEGVPLVMPHRPQLVLCGHTHGGQVALPGRPIIVPGEMGRRWPAGLYRVDDARLFVSRGLGMSDVPLRTFAPSDVGLFDLVAV